MVDVLLDSQDIRVLGGPSIVNLEVDFGKEGVRGSEIHAGYGKPVGENLPPSYQLKDLYINIDPNDDEYSCVYQYVTVVVDESAQANDWVLLFRIAPSTFNVNATLDFVAGAASYALPVSNFLSQEVINQLTAEILNVQITLESVNPTAVSISGLDVTVVQSPAATIVTIGFSGADFDGTTWAPLDGLYRAQMQFNLAVDQDNLSSQES